MTERDFRTFKKLAFMVPIVTVIATVLIQWGYWQATATNIQTRLEDQKIEWDKKFERVEREKANAALVESKFDNIDWKLGLIMSNMGIKAVKRDTL